MLRTMFIFIHNPDYLQVTGRDIESLRWEVGDLQGNLRGAEERSKAWVQVYSLLCRFVDCLAG